jgi:hypothetical protein
VLGESTAASLSATALMMGAMDNAITNEQQRRYLRDVAEETTLAPYWKNVHVSRRSIEEAAGAAVQAADALKAAPGAASAPAPVATPPPAATGHATTGDALAGAADDDGKESLGSLLGNEGAAEAARSGAEESERSDWLGPMFAAGPSEEKGEAGQNVPAADDKDAAAAAEALGKAVEAGKTVDEIKDVLPGASELGGPDAGAASLE